MIIDMRTRRPVVDPTVMVEVTHSEPIHISDAAWTALCNRWEREYNKLLHKHAALAKESITLRTERRVMMERILELQEDLRAARPVVKVKRRGWLCKHITWF
jgi:hypothetical protein